MYIHAIISYNLQWMRKIIFDRLVDDFAGVAGYYVGNRRDDYV